MRPFLFGEAMNRAYSTIEFKSVDGEARTLEGIASTPSPDRMNDAVEPLGMEFKLPYPFLYQHDSRKPIGSVVAASATKDGLRIKVQIAKEGVAPYIDEAWALIKAGLVRGLSIGFRSLEESWDKEINGYRYLRTEIMETSAVTIPANAEASITSIKSIADGELAALGTKPRQPVRLDKANPPGASGKTSKRENMKPIADRIKEFEATRAAKSARMTEIMNKADEEGRTLNETESQEHDDIRDEIKGIDEHLSRLRDQEKMEKETAKPVTGVTDQDSGSRVRGGVITVKGANVLPGTAFCRYVQALVAAKGDPARAAAYAGCQSAWKDQTPQVQKFLSSPMAFMNIKEAVAGGSTTADGWASELVEYRLMANEFIEFLRPKTIIGKLPLRRVPFNITIASQSSGSTAAWVPELGRKPLTKLGTGSITLGHFTAAAIVTFSKQLARFSSPSIEQLVRDDLSGAIINHNDGAFIVHTNTAVAGTNPAAINNGAGTAAASGVDAADLRADIGDALSIMLAAEIDAEGIYIIMSPTQALKISLMRNALGQKEFPDITPTGGFLEGCAVVTSNKVGSGVVTILKASEVLLADDGGVTVDVSEQASLVMDDGGSPEVTEMVSMFQTNQIAVRAERTINWARRRDAAVYYFTACNYGGVS